MPNAPSLFAPYRLGRVTLANRVVMAPMTRCRALGNVVGANVATYYAQRASAGLLITEGTAPNGDGLGYARMPGVYTDEQVAGWRVVTDAVHAKGGVIYLQMMHTGRMAHPANLPAGARVLAPSAIAAPGQMYTDAQGMQPHPTPIAMTEQDIEGALQAFVSASRRAIEAGFDGVELHGANGYLIDQFLNAASNQRADRWGGSIDGRARFPLVVAERVANAIGADRTGIRLSPYGANGGMAADTETDTLYLALSKGLSSLGLAYLHLADHSAMGAPQPPASLVAGMRTAFRGTFLRTGGYDANSAAAALASGGVDLVGFGRPFISNPELVRKLRTGEALTPPDFGSFYTPDDKGYIDYL